MFSIYNIEVLCCTWRENKTLKTQMKLNSIFLGQDKNVFFGSTQKCNQQPTFHHQTNFHGIEKKTFNNLETTSKYRFFFHVNISACCVFIYSQQKAHSCCDTNKSYLACQKLSSRDALAMCTRYLHSHLSSKNGTKLLGFHVVLIQRCHSQ